MPSTLRKTADPLAARADLLVVTLGATTSPLAGPARAADHALSGLIARSVRDGEIDGSPGSVAVIHAAKGVAAPRVAVVGTGDGATADWRTAGRAAARRAAGLRARRVAFAAPEGADPAAMAAFVEGFGIGSHTDDRFTSSPGKPGPERLAVHSATTGRADLARGDAIAEAVNAARRLVDAPANRLTPSDLAAYARDRAAEIPGLSATVLTRARLEKMGAGALLSVAAGSEEPPAMIVLRYRPPEDARPDETLGIVGKAVTFDTGGISIKPSSGMEEMKMDMGGGAAALEGIALIARLGVPIKAIAVIPATENMPDGRATRPGDVVSAMNGKTIEVINTDAEGRLILADALCHAVNLGATRLVDLATLTGAIVVALGSVYAGLFGSDEEWVETLRAAGEDMGDLAWPMPLHEGYRPLIESRVADLSNAAKKREAGAVYAAMFLREFTDGRPWCHVDIAGTGMVDGRGTGAGVRLLLGAAERLARATD